MAIFGFSLYVSFGKGVPVTLTIFYFICSDFESMLSVGGSG